MEGAGARLAHELPEAPANVQDSIGDRPQDAACEVVVPLLGVDVLGVPVGPGDEDLGKINARLIGRRRRWGGPCFLQLFRRGSGRPGSRLLRGATRFQHAGGQAALDRRTRLTLWTS